MPRFVILEHDHPVLHWDLMLEAGPVLRTWRLARPPEGQGGAIPTTALADHRLHYLDYEGPVSGDRGTVKQWDRGTYELVSEDAESLQLRFDGGRVREACRLVQVDGAEWKFECYAASG